MKTKKLFFALLSAVTTVSIAQNLTTHGLVIGNSGNGVPTNFSIYDDATNAISFQETVEPLYVQYCLTENNMAYLAASDSIFKYDVVTEERVGGADFTPLSTNSMIISGDFLLVGNQFGSDTANLEVFNKSTMAQEALVGAIDYPVTDMVEHDGKIYVLQNIKHTVETSPFYFTDSLGFISVLNASDFSLESTIQFDATQAYNFKKVFVHNDKLTIFGTHEFGTTSHHVYTYDITSGDKTYNTFPHPINLTYGNQSSQKDNTVIFKFNGGIGSYDLEGDSVLNSSIIPIAATSLAVDWNNDKIYIAKGDYYSSAFGNIYNLEGDSIGTFTPGNGYAPEAMAVINGVNVDLTSDYGRLKVYGQYDISDYALVNAQTPQVSISILNNDQNYIQNTVEIVSQGQSGTGVISTSGTVSELTYSPTDYTDGTLTDTLKYRIANVFGDYDTTDVVIDWLEINATFVDFDELDLGTTGYNNGSDLRGGFISSNYNSNSKGAYFKNSFNPTWGSWSGISASNHTDNSTVGFTNGFSTYTGNAASGDNFAVTNGGTVEFEISSLYGVKSLDISNSTYAALSMLNGDSFAKKFGGSDGTDEDWFKVTIFGYDYDNNLVDTMDVFLADFRFPNSADDFILDSWKTVDFTSTAIYNNPVKTLQFKLSSTDVGNWGMNTPATFCLDNIDCSQFVGTDELVNNEFRAFPNPTQGKLVLNLSQDDNKTIEIFSVDGKRIQVLESTERNVEIDLTGENNGLYFISIKSKALNHIFKIVKQ